MLDLRKIIFGIKMACENTFKEWASLAPWGLYGSDIVLRVDHVLTEPVCPTAVISFELPERAGIERIASAIGDTVDEAIAKAVEAARTRLAGLPFEMAHFMRGVEPVGDLPFIALRPWRHHASEENFPPGDLDPEQIVEVCRRGPDAVEWLVAEAHQLDWAHTGGKEDIVRYRPVMRRR